MYEVVSDAAAAAKAIVVVAVVVVVRASAQAINLVRSRYTKQQCLIFNCRYMNLFLGRNVPAWFEFLIAKFIHYMQACVYVCIEVMSTENESKETQSNKMNRFIQKKGKTITAKNVHTHAHYGSKNHIRSNTSGLLFQQIDFLHFSRRFVLFYFILFCLL